jgi:hypothetical protein
VAQVDRRRLAASSVENVGTLLTIAAMSKK